MSWHYSQEQGGAFSAESYLAGLQSARWKLNHTHATVSSNANETESSHHSPSGTMCVPLTENHGTDLSTSSAVASPAKTLAPQEREQVSPGLARGSGRRCSESFARFDRRSLSWKTPQCSLLGDSELFSATWPKQGTMLRGVCSERTIWEPHMSARESGFSHMMPTPTACNAPNSGSNTTGPKSLVDVAQTDWNPGIAWGFPTPTCRGLDGGSHSRAKLEKIGFFPTPVAHNAMELTACPANLNRKSPGLGTLAAHGKLGTRGKLNPTWVEWLMGWPLEWTDLKPLAMDKCLSWQQQHSQSYTTH